MILQQVEIDFANAIQEENKGTISLHRDLRRAEIEPYAWVINNCLSPLNVTDPQLLARQKNEARYIREVVDEHARRTALIPWQIESPVGQEALKRALQAESRLCGIIDAGLTCQIDTEQQ